MNQETSIKQIIQGIAPAGVRIVTGRVISGVPFKVQLINDMKIILSKASMVIPARLGDLKETEGVYLLAVNNQKIYYVLDRV